MKSIKGEIALDPGQPDRMLVGVGEDVWRSTDGRLDRLTAAAAGSSKRSALADALRQSRSGMIIS